jgi:hypothetical protein
LSGSIEGFGFAAKVGAECTSGSTGLMRRS